ncbi:MAG: hypothetical protein ACK5QC_00685 [Bacteroidota bacterium]
MFRANPIKNFTTPRKKRVCGQKLRIDLYSGGQKMPGRTWTSSPDKYRYTHNGHEREDAIFEGAQSAEYWMYDSRIIRRWNVDPITDESLSPYACFANNPIYFADPDGLKPKGDKDKNKSKSGENKGGDNVRNKKEEPTFGNDRFYKRSPEGTSNGQNNSSSSSSNDFSLNSSRTGFAGKQLFIPAIPAIEGLIAGLEWVMSRYFAAAATAVLVDAVTTTTTEEDIGGKWQTYEIFYTEINTKTGNVVKPNFTYKYGITGQNINTDGTHPRPSIQVNSLNAFQVAAKAYDPTIPTIRLYDYRIIISNVNKVYAEYMEQQGVNYYYSIYGEQPEGNKKPFADFLRGKPRKKFEKIDPKKIIDFIEKINKR